jgi:hypothetical protein
MSSGRRESRIMVASLGLLELLGKPRDSERAWIENISDHGARLVAPRSWRTSERLLISSRCPPFRSIAASVVYCQTLPGGLFAIGCECTIGGLLQLLGLKAVLSARGTVHSENANGLLNRSGPVHAKF